jgi:gamma-glutamyltranspeptidase/glutathione hydrolase
MLDHARTLDSIAMSRGESFYRGELAEKIVAHARATGGSLTMQDLASHSCDWVGTISTDYHGQTLHEIPPNGQGIAALMMLSLLAGFDLSLLGRS